MSMNHTPKETSATNSHDNLDQMRCIMRWVNFYLLTPDEFRLLREDNIMKHREVDLVRYHINREDILPLFIQKLNMYIVN